MPELPRALNTMLHVRPDEAWLPTTYRLRGGRLLDFVWTGFEDPGLLVDVGDEDGARSLTHATTHVLSRHQLEILRGLDASAEDVLVHLEREAPRVGDVGVLEDPEKPVPPAKAMDPDEENSIQSKPEATIFKNPDLIKVMEKTVRSSTFCKHFAVKDLVDVRGIDLPRNPADFTSPVSTRPALNNTFSCLGTGDVVLAASKLWIYNTQFDLPPGGKIVLDDYETQVEMFRTAFARESFKSTKIGIGLAVAVTPAIDPAMLDPKKLLTVVKKGQEAFDKGEPKKGEGEQDKEPARVGVGFNGAFLNQHYRASLSAQFRYKITHRVKRRQVITVTA